MNWFKIDRLVVSEGSRFLPAYLVGVALTMVVVDYLAGPMIQFPVMYIVPIGLAAWKSGRAWGLAFAILLPLFRLLSLIAIWDDPFTLIEAVINYAIRSGVFAIFVVLIDRVAKQTRQLSREVKQLTGLLPICSFCKKIRDDQGQWQVIERYITHKTEASFSHSFCPECMQEHYGQYMGEL